MPSTHFLWGCDGFRNDWQKQRLNLDVHDQIFIYCAILNAIVTFVFTIISLDFVSLSRMWPKVRGKSCAWWRSCPLFPLRLNPLQSIHVGFHGIIDSRKKIENTAYSFSSHTTPPQVFSMRFQRKAKSIQEGKEHPKRKRMECGFPRHVRGRDELRHQLFQPTTSRTNIIQRHSVKLLWTLFRMFFTPKAYHRTVGSVYIYIFKLHCY